ncbi:MAG: nicotinamide mononucleotide transporter [Alistipes sp.]|nr:nicotinamide mononucleotide transporter [Alistipes sp.]
MELKLFLQIVGVVLGLLYLWLEYRANTWLWIVGMLMPCVHCVLYYQSGLYADCAMQGYYIVAGLYGLIAWLIGHKSKEKPLKISHTPLRLIAPLVTIYCVLHIAIYYVLVHFTDSTVPFWDAMTTAMSMVAMWMLSRKYMEQWLVWCVVDAITVGLYLYKGIPLTALLYALYTALAIAGYLRWKREELAVSSE